MPGINATNPFLNGLTVRCTVKEAIIAGQTGNILHSQTAHLDSTPNSKIKVPPQDILSCHHFNFCRRFCYCR